MSIAQRHAECYLAFQELCEATQGSEQYHDLPDEFDKYCLWAGNVGAPHSRETYKLSLDYRLREASFYKDQVCHTFLILNVEISVRSRLSAQGASMSETYHRTEKKPLSHIKGKYGIFQRTHTGLLSRFCDDGEPYTDLWYCFRSPNF